MSQHQEHQEHQEHHTGPITTPKQVLWTSVFAFVVPVFIIIALVAFVVSGARTAPGGDNSQAAVDARISKIGEVAVKGANAPARTGQQVFQAQCIACHGTGVAGAPKFKDKAAWAPRIEQGYNALVEAALKGKGTMPAQGGGDASDFEVVRATVYMVNNSGGNLPEPVQGQTGVIDGEILTGQ